MERLELGTDDFTEFGTTGVSVEPHARVGEVRGFAVDLVHFAPGSVLGAHPTGLWQLFRVVHGSGWVAGGDATRHQVSSGVAVLWEPGEVHESGSELGMTVVVIQSPVHPFSAE